LPKIVVNKHTPSAVEAFSQLGTVVALDTLEVTSEAVRDADLLVVRSETKVDRALLEQSRVKFVGTVTIGFDHVDTEYLASRGIVFANAPGCNANSVADYIAAALLAWARRTGSALRGKSIGVVGVGHVGSKVERNTRALGMRVLLNDPPLARQTRDGKYRPLDELMDADFITLHVPLTKTGSDATYHLFDRPRIEKMKAGSVLLNTSRGAVVDTKALIDVLASKHLSAAILDVWEGEPEISLELLSGTMLATPHIAGHSLDGKLNGCRMIYEEAARFLHVTPDWHYGAPMTPDEARIVVPAEPEDEWDVILIVVQRAYDIESDDRLLRKINGMRQDERRAYFMKLRSEYRIRREFFNRTVVLGRHQAAAVPVLEGLGFKTIVRKEKY
jgi:erythronate-4-phosphate dehydrogenase